MLIRCLIALTVFLPSALCALEASLTLIEYDPLYFEIAFSEVVSRPDFTLLLNNVKEMPYSFVGSEDDASAFYFQAERVAVEKSLETYTITFTSPLSIGNGDLSVNYFMLTAGKTNFEVDYPAGLMIAAIFTAYALVLISELAHTMVEFLQTYSLLMLNTKLRTNSYLTLDSGLLFIDPNRTNGVINPNTNKYMALTLPLGLLLFLGVLGLLVKKWQQGKQRSVVCNILYEIVSMNLFVDCVVIFVPVMLFNSSQIFYALSYDAISDESFLGIGGVLSYFNLVSVIGCLYLFLVILNPKISRPQ